MSSRLKVGVKFCGNCNPHIDSGEVYQSIKEKMKAMDGVELASKDTPGLDVLLVISGCPVDCAERPRGEYREIVAAGETVNRVGCPPDQIPKRVSELLKQEKS